MVSAECAPIAKAGGLGDVVHGLSRELASRGEQVEVLLPDYDCLRRDQLACPEQAVSFSVPFEGTSVACQARRCTVDGVTCRLIAADSPARFFCRGRLYGEPDDAARFAFFCRAAVEWMRVSGQWPDLIHCHDWQTGLVPVLLRELGTALGAPRVPVCYTLHNLGYQGQVEADLLDRAGLDAARLIIPQRLLDPAGGSRANLMQGGIVDADFVTTVSPRYAWEVRHTEQGMGLQDLLRQHSNKFAGVLNGIDYQVWDPRVDRHIPVQFGVENLPLKADNRGALRQRLGLGVASKPIVAVVSRLDHQKGVHLVEHGLRFALAQGCQFVLLGTALDPRLDALFRGLAHELAPHPDAHLELGYDETLAHLIYAGADMILIPSLYEPCGLTQMIAMRYGVVPVVRRVGGLADTVFDANYSDQPFERRNGYLFDEPTTVGLEGAFARAIGLWQRFPEYFRQLRLNGMRAEHSWSNAADEYLHIYRRLCAPAPPD